jgi:hypothetical protein
MNINESLGALSAITADFNRLPSRINDSFNNPESKESLEKVFTDMMTGENAYTANVKSIRTMNTVEQVLLDELRKE